MTKKITITEDDHGERLDIVLASKLEVSRSQVQKMIDAKQITVNGKQPKKAGDTMKEGYVIVIDEKKETTKTAKKSHVVNQPIPSRTRSKKALVPKVISETPDFVVDPGVARDLSSILSNNEARFPEYPPNNPLHFAGYDVAAKTGTTNDYRDAWTVGYTPTLAVGVWAGNNDNSPMVKEIAGYIVAPMWHAFMEKALVKVPKEFFGEPRGISDTAPGILRGDYIGSDHMPHDILYFVDKNNPQLGGGSLGDSQYAYWEYPVTQWLAANPGYTGQ
jgi:membrane carboxypeptidase/penicillin-binding protein